MQTFKKLPTMAPTMNTVKPILSLGINDSNNLVAEAPEIDKLSTARERHASSKTENDQPNRCDRCSSLHLQVFGSLR
jgi:hypothetical protein